MDQYVKRVLKIKYYVRHMDDFIFLLKTKDVNVNSFCSFLAKKYVGFWQRFMRGEFSPFYGIFVLENAFAKLSTNASTLIVLSFSKVRQ